MDVKKANVIALSRTDRGFTLIEIAFAILLLAGSLVVILGLQSSSIQRTIRDRNSQQAMLVAREIFAAIETAKESVPIGQDEGPVEEILRQFTPFKKMDHSMLDTGTYLRARLNVQYWELPKLDPQAVKRIELTVSWGEARSESISVVYFVPEEPKEQPEEANLDET